MPVRVSTKVEEAWYVDPDLLAGDENEPPQPDSFEVDVDGPLPRDVTVALGEGDLEEFSDGLDQKDDAARHYRDVSLRGAVLVNETEPDEEPSWSERIMSKFKGRVPSLDDEPPAPGASSAPPPPLADNASPEKPPPSAGPPLKQDATSKKAGFSASIAQIFEPGRVPPIVLAAVSFFLGVITTLLGVLLAL